MNEQAQKLNEQIIKTNPAIVELLSARGKNIFFPEAGILAQTAEAKGKAINATIGIALDDAGIPLHLPSTKEHVTLQPREIYPYAPSFGNPELRKKWRDRIYFKNKSLQGKQISLPVVTAGLTHTLSLAGYLFIDNEEIITPDLFWGNYKLTFKEALAAKLTTFPTFQNGAFNTVGLKEQLSASGKKKTIIFNFPNNPSGYMPTKEEFQEVAGIIREAASEKKILVIVDDAYIDLVYEDPRQESLFAHLVDLHENVLTIKADGATKGDYVWGLRIGFLTFNSKNATHQTYEALENKAAGAIRGNISNASNLSQNILLHTYNNPSYRREVENNFTILRERYREVKRVLREHPEFQEHFTALPFNAGYFLCIQLKNQEAEPIRQQLLTNYDMGIIALGNKIRLAFSAIPKSRIEQAFMNIYEACNR